MRALTSGDVYRKAGSEAGGYPSLLQSVKNVLWLQLACQCQHCHYRKTVWGRRKAKVFSVQQMKCEISMCRGSKMNPGLLPINQSQSARSRKESQTLSPFCVKLEGGSSKTRFASRSRISRMITDTEIQRRAIENVSVWKDEPKMKDDGCAASKKGQRDGENQHRPVKDVNTRTGRSYLQNVGQYSNLENLAQ